MVFRPNPPPAPAPELPAAHKPFIDPETLSTAGRQRPEEVYCCQLIANGRIAADTQPFREFWAKYPKKMKREEAADAWNRTFAPGTSQERATRFDCIMRFLASEMEKLTKEGGQYAPQPAKWLDSNGWTALEDAAKAEAQRRAERQAIEAARPQPTAEQIAAREAAEKARAANESWTRIRIAKESAIFLANGMNPLNYAEKAQIDAEIEQLKKGENR